MAITAAMVKELREATGVGMMDCKRHWWKQTEIWIRQSSSFARRDLRKQLRKQAE